MEEDSLKRHRTSPRVVVINEIQAIMVPHMDAIEVLLTRSDNDMLAEETTLSTLVREHLTAIQQGVEALRAGHPKTDKDDTSTSPKVGTHFVGITGEGKVLYLRRDKVGVYHTDTDNTETLVSIYGAFNTESGARYAVEHNTYTTHPKVQ